MDPRSTTSPISAPERVARLRAYASECRGKIPASDPEAARMLAVLAADIEAYAAKMESALGSSSTKG